MSENWVSFAMSVGDTAIESSSDYAVSQIPLFVVLLQQPLRERSDCLETKTDAQQPTEALGSHAASNKTEMQFDNGRRGAAHVHVTDGI
jgi:hypothetical protein